MNIYVRKALKTPAFMIWFILAVLLILVPVAAPVIAPHDPLATNYGDSLNPGNAEYPLGTDQIGRCILSRLIYGGRTSLLIVFWVIFIVAVTPVSRGDGWIW